MSEEISEKITHDTSTEQSNLSERTLRQKIVFIVNPHSGVWSKTNWIALATKMLAQDYDLEFKYTTHKGHACELAQAAISEGVKTIVAVGGDGTVNEIASSIIHTDTAMAIMPMGSGNGLARDLGISTIIPFHALEAIKKQKVVEIDFGLANHVPFFCTCGVGFDAHVSHLFAGNSKRGFLNYVRLAIREYFHFKPIECTLHYADKSESKRAFMINCANTRQFGNNAYIAPHADYQDGLLNITIVKPFGFWGAIRLGSLLFLKGIDKVNKVETFTCSKIEINLPTPVPYHYDGEPAGLTQHLEIEVIAKGLKVIVP